MLNIVLFTTAKGQMKDFYSFKTCVSRPTESKKSKKEQKRTKKGQKKGQKRAFLSECTRSTLSSALDDPLRVHSAYMPECTR